MSDFICSVCNRTYKYKKTLFKHQRKDHDMCIKTRAIQCDICNNQFLGKLRLRLSQHIKKEHNNNKLKPKLTRLLCPITECEETFSKHVYLQKHLQEAHSHEIHDEICKFHNMTGKKICIP